MLVAAGFAPSYLERKLDDMEAPMATLQELMAALKAQGRDISDEEFKVLASKISAAIDTLEAITWRTD